MKINKFIGLVACAMAFSACQNDVLEGGMQQNKIYTLSGNMSAGKAMSRAQIELGNSNSAEEIAYWNEGDAFTLYQVLNKTLTGSVFTISADYKESGDDKKNAMFSTNQPATVDVKYKAVYPASTRMEGHSVKFDLQHDFDFSGATTVEARNEIWSDYMRNNMYMMAEGTLISGGINVLSFRHLCALARVTYTNATTEIQSIKNLSLGGDQTFTTSTSYNLYGSYQDGSGSTNSYQLNLNGLTVEPGQTVDMYAFFYPHEFNLDGELHLNVNTNSGYKGVRLATTTISEANGGAKGFEAGKRYWFKVTESSEGLVWSKDFSMETVTINNKALSLALQSVLGEDVVSLNEDSCAVIDELMVKSLKTLDFGGYENRASLTSLEGIEAFESLEVLNCNETGLTSLKLTNPTLRRVSVENTPLTSLDVSGLSKLSYLSCAFCGELGDNINVDGTNLEEIRFQHTNATQLPKGLIVSQLIILDSGDNQLTNLDLSESTILKELYLARNDLSNETLLLPQNNNLRILDISGNGQFTAFDLTQSPKLTYLWASGDAIESLDFSKCPDIEFISCGYNKLTELDLTNNENIYYLECGNQKDERILTLKLPASLQDKWNNEWASSNSNHNVKLDASSDDDTPSESTITIKNTELATALQAVLGADKVTIDPDYGYAIMKEDDVLATVVLDFDNYTGTITSLSGIEVFSNLRDLECRNVGLKECTLTNLGKLVSLNVQSNELEALSVSGCTELQQLVCSYNQKLYKMDLTGCIKLSNLQAQDTALTELNIPNPKVMDNFLLPAGLDIDFEKFPYLTGLGLGGRGLDNLDMIPENIKAQLGYLKVDNNNLTVLDLSEFPKLQALDCGENNLTQLDLSVVPSLHDLYCTDNLITELDITKLGNLGSLGCGSQKNEIILTLTLTESQKSIWDNNWGTAWGNNNVKVVVSGSGSTTGNGSNNTSGSDFTIEGIY